MTFGQSITRLSVSGGNGQVAARFVAELLRHLLDAFGFAQHFTGNLQNRLTCGRDAR